MRLFLNKIITILMVNFIFFTSSFASPTVGNNLTQKWITARITYYTPASPYGDRVACQKAKRAKEGITVAAHPKLPFGTRVEIPDLNGIVGSGHFIVQDRGSAVTKKTASRGKADVIDVYLNSNQKLIKLTKIKPEYMKVRIIYHK